MKHEAAVSAASPAKSQFGINMVDLMMWLVIAALLLAAALQGIGYYQSAANVYTLKNDVKNAASVAHATAANGDGRIDDSDLDATLVETKVSNGTILTWGKITKPAPDASASGSSEYGFELASASVSVPAAAGNGKVYVLTATNPAFPGVTVVNYIEGSANGEEDSKVFYGNSFVVEEGGSTAAPASPEPTPTPTATPTPTPAPTVAPEPTPEPTVEEEAPEPPTASFVGSGSMVKFVRQGYETSTSGFKQGHGPVAINVKNNSDAQITEAINGYIKIEPAVPGTQAPGVGLYRFPIAPLEGVNHDLNHVYTATFSYTGGIAEYGTLNLPMEFYYKGTSSSPARDFIMTVTLVFPDGTQRIIMNTITRAY